MTNLAVTPTQDEERTLFLRTRLYELANIMSAADLEILVTLAEALIKKEE